MKKNSFWGIIGRAAVLAAALVFGLALGGCATYGAGFSMMAGEASGEEMPTGLTENEQATGLKQTLSSVSVFGSNEYSELSAGNVFGTIERTNTSYDGEVTTEELDISGWALNYYLKVPIHLFKDRLTIFPMAGLDIHGYGDDGLMAFLKVGGGLDVSFGKALFLRGRVGYAPLGLTGMTFGLSLGYRTLGDKVRSRYRAPTPDLTGVTTYYVRANGDDGDTGISEKKPFKTLATAIEAASGTPLKTITVIGTLPSALPNITEGTGAEEILVTGKAGATGKDKAVLQIPNEGSRLTVGGDSRIRLEHITITGGKKGGISVREGATVTLGQGAVVSGNDAAYGGGILVLGGTLVLSDNALVTKNSANKGGGIALSGGTLLMRDDALVSENETDLNKENKDGEGGGVYVENAEVAMEGNAAVVKNKGYWGGGVYTDAKGTLVMRGNASLRDNSIFYNTPKSGTHIGSSGGGAYIEGSLTMRDASAVSGNEAAFGGGIFLHDGSTLVMEDRSVVKGNLGGTGTESDGTLFGGYGGGVSLGGGSRLTMRGESSLDGNSGFYGGGLRATGNAQVVLEGNASVRNNKTLLNSEKKHGGYGGGAYLGSAGVSLVLKDDVAITDNTAHQAGGGVYVSAGKLALEGNAGISGNNGTLSGGGVFVGKGGSITGNTSRITGNEALITADLATVEE